jgi:hypothetical protein
MKRFLVAIFSLILLLSLGTATFATVDVGGNLRVLYKNGSDDTNTFNFDRLALKFSSSLSDVNGFKSEIRYTPLNGLKFVEGYYYQKNLLAKDELQAGMITIPSYNDKYVALQDTIGKKNSPANSVGMKYGFFSDFVDFSLAIANANNENTANSSTVKGFDYGARVSVRPVEGLTISAAYDGNVYDNNNHTNNTLLVDALYNYQPFTLYTEYVAYNPNNTSNKTGFYIEPSYKISDNVKVYIGSTLGAKDGGIAIAGAAKSCDYQVGGVIYQIQPKTALQLEYLNYNEPESKNYVSLRLKVDF